MSSPEHLGVRSPNYPKEESYITLSPMDFGVLSASFEATVVGEGNDTTATWPSMVEGSTERFTVSYEGEGSTLLEGRYWGIWLLSFSEAAKTLRIDIGNMSVERFDGQTFIPGGNEDVSDVFASYFNLCAYEQASKRDTANGLVRWYLGIKPIPLNPEQ